MKATKPGIIACADDRITSLDNKCEEKKLSLKKIRTSRRLMIVSCLFILPFFIGFLLYPNLFQIIFPNTISAFNTMQFKGIILIYLLVLISTFIAYIFFSSDRVRDLEIEIRDILNEIDLEKIEVTSTEARAEKLFKLHQYELEKYYNQNLRQGNQVFIAGLLFISIGFMIIGFSLYLITRENASNSEIVAILGAIGTILSNFIAAIYLKMFSETIKSATSFHNRLVATHNLMFGNYLTSKIKNVDLKEKTLSDISTNLGKFAQNKEE
jgi:hypothetical protein